MEKIDAGLFVRHKSIRSIEHFSFESINWPPQVTKMMEQVFKNGWRRSVILHLIWDSHTFLRWETDRSNIPLGRTKGESASSVMQSAKTMNADTWLLSACTRLNNLVKRVAAVLFLRRAKEDVPS